MLRDTHIDEEPPPKHEQHEEMVEWGGNFDPEKFDARLATKVMKKGLPDWRSMR